jgi:predicted site-specific integrase-resolvase
MLAIGKMERIIDMGDLSVKEVAKRLGLVERTATRYVNKGLFPGAYKLNPYALRRSEWRVPEEAVIAFEEKRRETAKKASYPNGHKNN